MNAEDIGKAIGVVKTKLREMRTSPSIATTTTTAPTLLPLPSTGISKKGAAKEMMNRLAGTDTVTSGLTAIGGDTEVALFTNAIKTKLQFREFWRIHRSSFPRLVLLVHRYCIIPATSVTSESAFSISGFLARKQRSSLSSRTLRHLLVLKYRKNAVKLMDKYQSPSVADPRTGSPTMMATG